MSKQAGARPNYNTADPAILLHRLDGVRQMSRDRWMARCPAHSDRSPSLSVRDTGDRVLVHCFAGCATEDVLAAVGLTFRDLYSDPWKAAYHAATAQGAVKLQSPDPAEVERLVVQIARDDLAAGKTLSVEDRARYELAIERLRATRRGAA